VAAMATPDPTNSPAPTTPPMAIMFSCRCDNPERSPGLVLIGPAYLFVGLGKRDATYTAV